MGSSRVMSYCSVFLAGDDGFLANTSGAPFFQLLFALEEQILRR